MIREPRSKQVTFQARAVTAALFGVVVMLGGLAVLQAVVGHRAAERLERSGDLVEAYLTINRAVALQDSIEDEYEDAPGSALRARFLAAARDTDAAVRVLLREGGPADVRHARRLAVTSRRYVAATTYYFDALDAGEKRLADYIDEGRVNAGSMVLATLTTQAGPRHAKASLRELDALKRTQRSLLRVTVVSIPLGLAVVAGLLLLLRSLRRRLDEAREQELARFERAALTDSLTGIRNHRAFEEDLARELARSARDGSSVALVMVDLDGLKGVNDAAGHQAGDRLIKSVAAALRDNARSARRRVPRRRRRVRRRAAGRGRVGRLRLHAAPARGAGRRPGVGAAPASPRPPRAATATR